MAKGKVKMRKKMNKGIIVNTQKRRSTMTSTTPAGNTTITFQRTTLAWLNQNSRKNSLKTLFSRALRSIASNLGFQSFVLVDIA